MKHEKETRLGRAKKKWLKRTMNVYIGQYGHIGHEHCIYISGPTVVGPM